MMTRRRRIGCMLLVAFSAGGWVAVAQPAELSRDEIYQFLLTAEIIASTRTEKGTTRPWRLTLSDGTREHDAQFQAVDRDEGPRRFGDRYERNFIDSYRYNVAAYRLAELVGLQEMMPVTVERTWDGDTGSLTWWIDDVMFNEELRLLERRWPEDMQRWSAQMSRMLLFAELVQDTDRNQTNVVYTRDWTLHMIDFSRAFRMESTLQRPGDLARVDRALLARLKDLTKDAIERQTDPYLTGREIDAVLDRRDAIVDHFARLIETKGLDAVLYE